MIRYVAVTFYVALILFVPIICIRRHLVKGKLKNDSWKHEIASIFFIFYILSLYQITALRWGGLGWDLEKMVQRRTRVNGQPFTMLWDWTVKGVWWHLFYNVVGNCIWFIPLGVMIPAIYKEFRKRPFWVIFIGMTVSSSIEVMQYIFCTGVTDIDDVIFNTLGTAIGYFFWYLLTCFKKRSSH